MTDADDTGTQIEQAMAGVRAAVKQQLGSARVLHQKVDIDELPRFSPDLALSLDPKVRSQLLAQVESLQPWLQGPFFLGGDLIVGGVWGSHDRWQILDEHVGDVRGRRVLDVGSNAGYDSFMFRIKGAAEVFACEPHEFIRQARFLEGIYRTGVRFEPLGWQELDPAEHGTFDLVYCHGVLYHEAHPMAMLDRLRAMVAPGGRLLLGSMMLADPELSEYARFIPNSYYDDSTWWWVPGRLAMRWMLEAVGFRITAEFGRHEGPPGEFATVNGYLEAVLSAPMPNLTSTRSSR